MKLKTKKAVLTIIWFAGVLIFGTLMVEVSDYFVFAFLFLFALIGFYNFKYLRCPQCKKDISYNPIKIFGAEFWMYTPVVPRYCSKCGYDLESDD